MIADPAREHRGFSGETEAEAFAKLPPPAEQAVERVAHLVLMQLLPALAEADLADFGAALSEIQRITGAWFAERRGERLLRERARSWSGSWRNSGPKVSGKALGAQRFTDSPQTLIRPGIWPAGCGQDWADSGVVYQTGFAQRGALVHTEWTAVGRD